MTSPTIATLPRTATVAVTLDGVCHHAQIVRHRSVYVVAINGEITSHRSVTLGGAVNAMRRSLSRVLATRYQTWAVELLFTCHEAPMRIPYGAAPKRTRGAKSRGIASIDRVMQSHEQHDRTLVTALDHAMHAIRECCR